MRRCFTSLLAVAFVCSIESGYSELPPEPNPESNLGALKSQITTGGSYDAHSGNITRIVPDLHVPNALGVYGLDFVRYFNSVEDDTPNASGRQSFGQSGWTHSWEWTAVQDGEDVPADDGGGPYSKYWTWVTVGFPDGHSVQYKMPYRRNGLIGPPYSPAEQEGFATASHVHDKLQRMAADGSEFWLYKADGGAVHFVRSGWMGNAATYQASEVFDPHGLHTTLLYDEFGNVRHIEQDGGRFLEIAWFAPEGFVQRVIRQVTSGGPAGVQTVTYHYNDTTPQNQPLYVPGFINLTSVTYPEADATYSYGTCFDSADDGQFCSGQSLAPLLQLAQDPHFAGAMTKIRYSYRGTQCYAPGPPGNDALPKTLYVFATPDSIGAERSGANGMPVSTFMLDCWGGYRQETNGFGARRSLQFGYPGLRAGGQGMPRATNSPVSLSSLTALRNHPWRTKAMIAFTSLISSGTVAAS